MEHISIRCESDGNGDSIKSSSKGANLSGYWDGGYCICAVCGGQAPIGAQTCPHCEYPPLDREQKRIENMAKAERKELAKEPT